MAVHPILAMRKIGPQPNQLTKNQEQMLTATSLVSSAIARSMPINFSAASASDPYRDLRTCLASVNFLKRTRNHRDSGDRKPPTKVKVIIPAQHRNLANLHQPIRVNCCNAPRIVDVKSTTQLILGGNFFSSKIPRQFGTFKVSHLKGISFSPSIRQLRVRSVAGLLKLLLPQECGYGASDDTFLYAFLTALPPTNRAQSST